MEPEERIQAASKFLLQAPPGQINDVLNDVRNIISDDDALKDGILPALRQYNLEQFTVVEVPGTQHQAIISEDAIVAVEGEEERFHDPRSGTTFKFDHLSLEASESQEQERDTESEESRAAFETAALTYLNAHYPEGVFSVFAKPGSAKEFVILIVANKYNPTNYWSGRWRSRYVVDLENQKISGKIFVNVHYYEQGNVQLATTHDVELVNPPAIASSNASGAASKILALIEEEERTYQSTLSNAYHEMGEKTFKGLRRALPMTRQKLDWDKVLGYKLGAELSASRGGFDKS